MKKRLAVVPSDPLQAYVHKGTGGRLEGYYNPRRFFDEVYLLSPYESREYTAFGMRVIPTQPHELAGRLQVLNIDIVRAYGGYWPCDFACDHKVPGIPVVVSVHDTNPDLLHPSIMKADYVLALSDAVRSLLEKSGVSSRRIRSFANRVDLTVFHPVADEQLEAEFRQRFPGRYRILHVGRRTEQKNLDTVIRSLPSLGPEYVAIFVGQGDRGPYEKLADELGVRSQCFFVDSVQNNELSRFYSFADCMCTPSRWEGFGLVFIEALACEAMVVTSDIEPMSEYIVHGESGILIKEYTDPVIMTAAIRSACEDADLRAEIKTGARDAARPFNKEAIDALEVGLYQQFLEARDRSSVATGRHVSMQIQQRNPWYTGKQSEWADKTSVKPIYQKRYGFFSRIIQQQKNKLGRTIRLLDAGCGDGYWICRLSDIDGVEFTGIDYNPLRVERARTAAPFADIRQADLLSLSCETRFDIVLLNQVIEHVKDDGGLLQAVKNLLSPDGVLILGTPNEGSPLHRLRNERLGSSYRTDHVHFYTEADVRQTVARAGFRIDAVMREVFCIGDDERYYQLLEQEWGFRLLEFLTFLVPTECSDYYFECRISEAEAEPLPHTLVPSVPSLPEIRQRLDEFIEGVRSTQAGKGFSVKDGGTAPVQSGTVVPGEHRRQHYLNRLPVYRILAEAELHNPDVRTSKELGSRLRSAGMVNTDLTDYWKRVSFISEHAHGRVLEIGAACGNITRYIAANPRVTHICAVDQQPEYIAQLKQYGFPKVVAVCADLRTYSFSDRFDCVVLGELIEHLTLEEEQSLVSRLQTVIRPDASFIITTPIGFMPDPDHVRGFSQKEFARHVQRVYGPVTIRGENGIQQFAVARARETALPMAPPRVSIVLPTYNHLAFLPRAVESVLAQSYRDLELIIVDDASTDGTDRYLQTISDPRVWIITHGQNERLPASLNDGLREARGEMLTWISADNYCYPRFVETLVAALDADPEAGMAVSSFAWINESGARTRLTSAQDFSLPHVISMNPGNASFMYRRAVQDRVGFYDESLEGAEDWDMWIRIVELYPVIDIPDILYDYREHGESMTARKKGQITRASASVFAKTVARWNGEFPLERLYPSLTECTDQVVARAHAAFDFGTLLLRSPFADPEMASAFLKQACAGKAGFIEATCNLAVAFIRCGHRESAESLAGSLEQVDHPSVKAILEGIRAGSSYELLPLFVPDAQSSELLRREEERKRVYSPAATGEEAVRRGVTSSAEEVARLHDLHATGDIENGIAALVRALELDPSNVATAKKLAHALLQADRFEEGLRLLAGTLRIAPDDTEVLVALAAIYRAAGRNADADLFLDRARSIDPAVAEPSGLLERTAPMDSRNGPGQDIPLSFCIITRGTREDLLRAVIASINAQGIPEYEIIVVGIFHDAPGVTYVSAEESARSGRLGEMRNAALECARYDNVVILDDDIVLSPDWYERLRQYGEQFEILTSQVRLPDGGRYWDHASFGGPRGQVILNPEESDDFLYMTGGGGWVIKRALWQEVRWNGGLGFYGGEDIEYAARLRERGYRISHNHHSIVFHADPVYTTIGRMVVRRSGGKSSSWVREIHEESRLDQLAQATQLHLQKGEAAEAADCLRFAASRFPDNNGITEAWSVLELQFGGCLEDACWYVDGDPGYLGAMSRFTGGADVSSPRAEPASDTQRAEVLWHAAVFNHSGYADEARNFVLSLEAHGMPVALREISNHSPEFYRNMNPDRRAKLDRSLSRSADGGSISIVHFPAYAFQRVPGAAYCIGRTMFESDGLPVDWVAACNTMDEVWVPTEFNMDTFRRSGVTVPLVKVPGGIDVDHYRPGHEPMAIPGTRGTVFLSVFEWTYRKGWDVLLKAWAHAFTPADDVSLVLRTSTIGAGNESEAKTAIETKIRTFFRQNGIRPSKVAPIVILDRPIPEPDLPRLYAAASACVAPSRGEGWGRPQMEAMACGLPVIATRWSGNLEFMNEENSLLVDVKELRVIDGMADIPFYRGQRWAEPDEEHLMMLLQKVVREPEFARARGMRARSDAESHWQWKTVTKIALQRLEDVREQIRRRNGNGTTAESRTARVCWEGAQFVHHSLAGINRQICSGLIAGGHEVSVLPTEKDTFAPPVMSPLRNVLDRMNKDLASIDIHVRHHWPPNLDPPEQGHWVVIQPWEFGSLPKKWVEVFSRQVDEMWVYSEYVRDVYVASGIAADRVAVVPCGIDPGIYHPGVEKYRLRTTKPFRFLFVGGTIFRKGIDILLGAYERTFTAADDVCLVIKDMGGDSFYRGQTFREEIEAVMKKPNAPAIEYIDRMLHETELAGLYAACDVLVHPYRGEGFGLPILESMACGTPAIVTDGGAARDFCTPGNSLLVKAERKRYSEKRISTYETVDYPWLYEVEIPDLAEQMQYALAQRKELRDLGERAAEDAAQWTWARTVAAVEARIEILRNKPVVREQQRTAPRASHPAEDAYLLALARYQDKQYREALEHLHVAESHLFQRGLPPDSVTEFDVAMRRGDCLVKLGMLQEAKTQYEQALRIDPLSAEACYNLGLCFELAGLRDPARTMYRCAIELRPDWEQARAKMRLLEEHPGVSTPGQGNQ